MDNRRRSYRGLLILLAAAVAHPLFSNPTTLLVPVFAENVPGALGSTWVSELRFYNSGNVTQTVTVERVLPLGASTCTGFEPITIAPHASRFTRSIGCSPAGAAALEISTDSSVAVSTVVTNVGGTEQNLCFLAGYTEPINILPSQTAYATSHTLTHLMSVSTGQFKPGRHNLGLVNPNPTSIAVALRYFDDNGIEVAPQNFLKTVEVPANSLVQVNDFIPPLPLVITPPLGCSYWRVEATATSPFYVYDSYVDTTTNDATFASSN